MKKLFTITFLVIVFTGTKVMAQGCGGPASDDAVKVFGFLQSQYEYNFQEPAKNSFTFERARIGVMGSIPYDFSYYVVAELSPFIAPNPYLLDAFITYSRFNWARLSLGSFKTPMGLEINTPCNGLLTVYRATSSLQMVAPFRDIGLVLMGGDETTFMTYQLGLMNGSGLGLADNNRRKDLVGRVLFKPADFIKVGGSFRTGYPSYNNNDDSRNTFAGEVQVNKKGFTLQAEYMMDKGDFNRDLGGGCSGNLIELGEKRHGGFATLAYLTKWNVEPVFKYDYFDSGNGQKYKESNFTYGVNYYFNDWTRLQVNYMYRAERPKEIKNDELVFQLQVKF